MKALFVAAERQEKYSGVGDMETPCPFAKRHAETPAFTVA